MSHGFEEDIGFSRCAPAGDFDELFSSALKVIR